MYLCCCSDAQEGNQILVHSSTDEHQLGITNVAVALARARRGCLEAKVACCAPQTVEGMHMRAPPSAPPSPPAPPGDATRSGYTAFAQQMEPTYGDSTALRSSGASDQISVAPIGSKLGATTTSHSPTIGASQSELSKPKKQKDEAKARFQEFLNSFVKMAVKGISCRLVGERGSPMLCAADYTIDRRLTYISLKAREGTDGVQDNVHCILSDIYDMYSFSEDEESCFPPHVLKGLSEQEKQMLIMVVYKNPAGSNSHVCFLEETEHSRDLFLECVRILCISARQTTVRPQATS